MIAPPARVNAARIRLPARLDTLAALRLPALLADAGGAIDASGVAEIGFAALQWLAAERARRGAAPLLADPSPALIGRARDGGFAAALLGEPAPAAAGPPARLIRFHDAALDFGREPLVALAALRARGAAIAARPRLGIAAEVAPDIVAFDIVVTPPAAIDDAALAEALAEFEDACAIGPDDAPAAPATAPPPAGGIDAGRLARVTALADELAAAQSSLAEALGPARIAVSAELGEVDRLWRDLQAAIAEIGAAPVATLLALPAHGWTWEGDALEIERGVIDRIAAPLAATLAAAAAGGTVSGRADGGFAIVALAPAPAADPGLAAAVEATGGRIEADDGRLLLRLPRSLSLVDALVVTVGEGRYALPVTHMIEALRPAAAAIHSVGPGRRLLRFGGATVPIVAVGEAFALAGWRADPTEAVLVIVETARGRAALLVDAIVDQQQVTVKPIEGIGRPPGTLGAAIVRGNRVALVIDVDALGD